MGDPDSTWMGYQNPKEIGQQQQIRGGGTSASIIGLEDAIDTAATNITRLQQSREQMELEQKLAEAERRASEAERREKDAIS